MNRIFNRINGILFAGLLGGILIVGLGSGIAFAEYMGFEYAEDQGSAEDQLAVEEFTYEMSPDESVIVPTAQEIRFDESVPVGTLLIEVEHNPQVFAVESNIHVGEPGYSRYATVIETYPRTIMSDFEMFMANKDAILQGLKDKRIVGLNYDYSFTTTVTGNPADRDRVFPDYDSAAHALADKPGA